MEARRGPPFKKDVIWRNYSRRARGVGVAGTIPCARIVQVPLSDQDAALDERRSAGRLKSWIDQLSPRQVGKVDILYRAFARQITADSVEWTLTHDAIGAPQ